MPSYAVDSVRMCPSKHINETDDKVDGLVVIAVRFQVPVRRPGVPDDCRAINVLGLFHTFRFSAVRKLTGRASAQLGTLKHLRF